MKLSVGKRILMFFHWLLSLLLVVGLALYVIIPQFVLDLYDKVKAVLGDIDMRIVGIVILAVYAILSIAVLCVIFKRKKRTDRGFITVDSSDTGRTRIAISAIESMVRQSVTNIDGITDMKISIDNNDDAISIGVVASIVNGGHVPTITMNMQRAIRQFVEMNCGVAVRQVHITINSVTSEKEGVSRKGKRGKKVVEPSSSIPIQDPPAQPAKEITPGPTPDPIVSTPTPDPLIPKPAPEAAVRIEPVVPGFEAARSAVQPEFNLDHKPTLTLDSYGTGSAFGAEEGPAEETAEAPETEDEAEY